MPPPDIPKSLATRGVRPPTRGTLAGADATNEHPDCSATRPMPETERGGGGYVPVSAGGRGR